jgi:hypothetical protein
MLEETDARRDDLRSDEPVEVEGSAEHGVTGPGLTEADANEVGPDQAREVPAPPVTGDEAIDEAMARLAESQHGSFAERIEAGEHAHHSLQSRLGGLGGA